MVIGFFIFKEECINIIAEISRVFTTDFGDYIEAVWAINTFLFNEQPELIE